MNETLVFLVSGVIAALISAMVFCCSASGTTGRRNAMPYNVLLPIPPPEAVPATDENVG